jgi:hypothetical protein
MRAAEKRYKRYNDGRADCDLSDVLQTPSTGKFEVCWRSCWVGGLDVCDISE